MTRALATLGLFATTATAGVWGVRTPPGFAFKAEPVALPVAPLTPTNFALAYDDRINTVNPSTPKERAANRDATLKRIEANTPKAATMAADDLAAHTADLLVVGEYNRALALLVPKSRDREPNYPLMANLVQAYALAGEWDQALRAYDVLTDADPPGQRLEDIWRFKIEKEYLPIWLKYHRSMGRDKPDPADLAPIPFFPAGPLPPDAVAVVQQMALDAPTDIYLLWSLADTTARAGELRAAAKLFDRCTNLGLARPKALMAKRAEVLDAVAKLPPETETALPADPPPTPKGLFDLVKPWVFFAVAGGFAVMAVVFVALQIRSNRRRRWRSGV